MSRTDPFTVAFAGVPRGSLGRLLVEALDCCERVLIMGLVVRELHDLRFAFLPPPPPLPLLSFALACTTQAGVLGS